MKSILANLRINLLLCSPFASHRAQAKAECLSLIIAAESAP
jgi:hypothetical protein